MITKFVPKVAAMLLCACLLCPIVAGAEVVAGDATEGQVVQDDEDYLESARTATIKEPSARPLPRSCGVVKKGKHIVATWGECAGP
ncbi:MAG: hypothetical protein ACNYPG_01030 [Candidatus Porifericomitaceae bacterium WSBS_2022_MAG_OTU9]